MSKLQKCIYIVNLLHQKGKLSLKEIEYYYSQTFFDDEPFSRRSFIRYKDHIEEILPYTIKYEHTTKSYSLCENGVRYGEDHKLYEYLLSLFNSEIASKLLIKHQDRIHNTEIVTGTENLLMVLQAIDQNLGIECQYSSYINSTIKNLILIPLFLTTWEGRWYLVAETTSHPEKTATYALERMDCISLTKHHLFPSSNISIDTYFNGCYGIQHDDNTTPIEIIFRAKGVDIKYLRTKPIHETQVEEKEDGEWVFFKINVSPCYNLYQEFFRYRENLEVISPKYIRDEIKEILNSILKNYETI